MRSTPNVLPRSPIGEAFQCAHNQWQALPRYFDDGNLATSTTTPPNTHCAVSPSDARTTSSSAATRGGHAAARFCSLVDTAKRHSIDPFAYLRDILLRIPTHPNSRLDELPLDN
jgi:hypothetical protein